MDNYDLMSRNVKSDLKKQLIESATSIGGKNHFLSLIEAVRMAQPNPLMSKDASFSFDKGLIKWEKVIYKEKVNLLMSLVSDNNQNLMPELGSRNYKTIKNLVRTIGPIKFKVRPKNIKNGKGFVEVLSNLHTDPTQTPYVVDLGSGGGVPALIIAEALPKWNFFSSNRS